MEMDDCAFPLLAGMLGTDDPRKAFQDADIALLVGARPRGPGMERKDLLMENAKIFIAQGRALNETARRHVRVLVVGNPANTNAYIAMKNAPDLDPRNFTAMMRLDHNRAVSQVAAKVGKPVAEIRKMIIWGNHSATQYPDLFQAEVGGKKLWPMINDQAWLEGTFIPTVQKRGAAIIEARGASSAASAANAAIDHVRNWIQGTPGGDWVTMGIPADGSYGIPAGVIYGYPVTCRNGTYEIVQGIDISPFSRARMDATHKELTRGARRCEGHVQLSACCTPPKLTTWPPRRQTPEKPVDALRKIGPLGIRSAINALAAPALSAMRSRFSWRLGVLAAPN